MKFEPPKITAFSESDHQKQCVAYAKRAGFGHLLICIPNGAHLAGDSAARARQMNHLKAMGLIEGASDLFLAKPVLRYHGAFFEMKKVTGRDASSEQLAFLMNMYQQGYYTDVCFGFDQWVESINNYLRGGDSPIARIRA